MKPIQSRTFADARVLASCIALVTLCVAVPARAQPGPGGATPPEETPPPVDDAPDAEPGSPTLAPERSWTPASAVLGATLTSEENTQAIQSGPSFIPKLEFSGSTKGEGKISVGMERIGARWAAAAIMSVSSTDGLATIFVADRDDVTAASSWEIGFDVTHIVPQSAEVVPAGNDAEAVEARARLAFECLAERPLGERSDDGAVRGLAQGIVHTGAPVDTERLLAHAYRARAAACPRAFAARAAAEADKKNPLPLSQRSVGVRFGRDEFTYLAAGADPMSLSKQTSKESHGVAGANLTWYMPDAKMSFELVGRIEHGYRASSTKAKWCTPVGTVLPPGGAPATAESCSELPVGTPASTTQGRFASYLGYVNAEREWRASMGAGAQLTRTDAGTGYGLSLEMPLYLTQASKEYAGLVRVTPIVEVNRSADGEWEERIVLTIALLGERTLFQTALQ